MKDGEGEGEGEGEGGGNRTRQIERTSRADLSQLSRGVGVQYIAQRTILLRKKNSSESTLRV